MYVCTNPSFLMDWIGLDSSKLKSKHTLNQLHFKVQTQKGTYQNYYWKEGFLVCDSLGYTLCFFPFILEGLLILPPFLPSSKLCDSVVFECTA